MMDQIAWLTTLAGAAVAVAIEVEFVVSDHLDGALNVVGAVANWVT